MLLAGTDWPVDGNKAGRRMPPSDDKSISLTSRVPDRALEFSAHTHLKIFKTRIMGSVVRNMNAFSLQAHFSSTLSFILQFFQAGPI